MQLTPFDRSVVVAPGREVFRHDRTYVASEELITDNHDAELLVRTGFALDWRPSRAAQRQGMQPYVFPKP